MKLATLLPTTWQPALESELQKPYIQKLEAFVELERGKHQVFPPQPEVFRALELTPLQAVRVVILGQDPYHDDNQAHGLAFSVRHGIKIPPSLVNMYKELETDLGIKRAKHGFLETWAEQGVLLLNTVLTVRAHEPASHKKQGWEQFTDAIIRAINAKPERVVFVLWGAHAQKKLELIDTTRHAVLQSVHPSPLSAKAGFFGSKPFSSINNLLQEPIDWKLE